MMTLRKKLLTSALALVLLLSGCSEQQGDISEQKINVFTGTTFNTQIMQKDFVIQLDEQEYVDLVTEMTTQTEAAEMPTGAPDYILQFMPIEEGGESVYWWVWLNGETAQITLVNSTNAPNQPLHSTTITSHQYGEMIKEATDGQGPKCC